MVFSSLFHNCYELFYEVKHRTALPLWMQWLRDIILLLQVVVFTLDFCTVKEFYENRLSWFRIINNIGLLNSWLIPTENSCFSLLGLLIFHVLFITMIIEWSKLAKKHNFLKQEGLFILRAYLEFFSPISTYQYFFLFSKQTLHLIDNFTLLNFVSFTLLGILIFIFGLYNKLSAVFLRPQIFQVRSVLDRYSGVTDTYYYWSKFFALFIQVILSNKYHFMLEIALYCLIIFASFYTVGLRIGKGVHVSIWGGIIEDAPLITEPLVLLYHLHGHWDMPAFYVELSCFIKYIIIYYLYTKVLYKHSNDIFSESNQLPSWLPYNSAYLMRNFAEKTGNVEAFEQFINMRADIQPDELIEAARFLGIFPQHRAPLIFMLSKWKSQDIYYDYQAYAFLSTLRALYESPIPYQIDLLDDKHRKYLVNMSLFWQARMKNDRWNAFVCATNAATNHNDLVNYIEYLINIYPFDTNLRLTYAEILLIGHGDPARSSKSRRLAVALKDHTNIEDPLLKKVGIRFPIANELLSSSKVNSGSSIDTRSLNSSQSKSLLRFHVDKTVLYREDGSETSPTAMFVQRAYKMPPYGLIFNLLILILLSYGFVREFEGGKRANFMNYIILRNSIYKTQSVSDNLTAAVIWPYFLTHMSQKFSPNTTDCDKYMKSVYKSILDNSLDLRLEFPVLIKAATYSYEYFTRKTVIYRNSCQALENLFNNVYDYADDLFNQVDNLISTATNASKTVRSNLHMDIGFWRLLYYVIFYVIAAFTISFAIMFLYVTKFNSNLPPEAIEFLGSKERLGLLLFKRSMESWDLFKAIFPIDKHVDGIHDDIDGKKKAMKIAKFPSQTLIKNPITSHHIDLKDSKLAISFIGVDDILRPSAFGLMSPFISNSSNSVFSNDMYESVEFSGTSLSSMSSANNSEKDINIVQETFDNFEIVTTTEDEIRKHQESPWTLFFPSIFVPWIVLLMLVGSSRFINIMRCSRGLEQLNYIDQQYDGLISMYNGIKNIYEKKQLTPQNLIEITREIQNLSRYLEKVAEDAAEFNEPSRNGVIAFYIFSGCLFWLINAGLFSMESHVFRGLASLFIFPYGYLDDYFKVHDAPPKCILPSDVIEVISNSDNGYISSVSSNCHKIIGTNPIDLIGRKFDEVFSSDGPRSRIFTFTNRKTKRFVECVLKMKHITKIALYDESSFAFSATKYIAQLSAYFPVSFAKTFCAEGTVSYKYSDVYTILCYFDTNAQGTEHLFSASQAIIQMYTTVHLMGINGSTLLFVCHDIDKSIPLLFIRDFIQMTKPLPNKLNSNPKSALFSMSITKQTVNANIDNSGELFLSCIYKYKMEQRTSTFATPVNCVSMLDGSLDLYDGGSLREIVPGITARIVSFDEIDKIIDRM